MIKKYILSPFQRFVQIESFSGILLMIATALALIWANSGFSYWYQALWDYEIGVESNKFDLIKPLILWINDGLMTVFFFLIGLEIKRELSIGELNSIRKATLPLFAAIGGMFFPLLVFIGLNQNPETTGGWGIPMATDIAFSLAILKLLGRSVPLSLKVFLTAFAIVDDLGAVLVIAVFYSSGIKWALIIAALAIVTFLYILSRRGIYWKYLSLPLAVIVWVLFLKSGIHPTIAGVLMALTIPIRQKIDTAQFTAELSQIATSISGDAKKNKQLLSKNQMEQLDNLEDLVEDYHSPLQYLEHTIHGWVAYLVMPIFALANAGVVISAGMTIDMALATNIALALFIGKAVGVTLMCFIALKLKVADLPQGVNFKQIIGVAILSGVGFTMSIFIANLAFGSQSVFVDSAKIGILAGSFISAIVGALVLKMSGKKGGYEEKAL